MTVSAEWMENAEGSASEERIEKGSNHRRSRTVRAGVSSLTDTRLRGSGSRSRSTDPFALSDLLSSSSLSRTLPLSLSCRLPSLRLAADIAFRTASLSLCRSFAPSLFLPLSFSLLPLFSLFPCPFLSLSLSRAATPSLSAAPPTPITHVSGGFPPPGRLCPSPRTLLLGRKSGIKSTPRTWPSEHASKPERARERPPLACGFS